MVVTTIILNCIGIIKKKSRLIFYLLLAWIWILFAFNTMNGDYDAYSYNYNYLLQDYGFNSFGLGYTLFQKLATYFNLDYQGFLLLFSFVGLVLIAVSINNYTEKGAIVLSLYIIYPFFWDVTQIRNFFSMAIIIYFSKYILSQNKNYMKYIIGVIIAAQFHISALFYLLFILIKFFNLKRITMISTFITILLLAFSNASIGRIILKLLSSEGKMKYFLSSTTILTKVAIIVLFSLNILVSYIIYKKMNSAICEERNVIRIDYSALLKINIILIIMLPFVLLNLDFIRLFRNISILNYIAFVNCISIKKLERIKFDNFILINLELLILLLCFLWLTIYVTNGGSVINSVFNNNLLFK